MFFFPLLAPPVYTARFSRGKFGRSLINTGEREKSEPLQKNGEQFFSGTYPRKVEKFRLNRATRVALRGRFFGRVFSLLRGRFFSVFGGFFSASGSVCNPLSAKTSLRGAREKTSPGGPWLLWDKTRNCVWSGFYIVLFPPSRPHAPYPTSRTSCLWTSILLENVTKTIYVLCCVCMYYAPFTGKPLAPFQCA